MGEAGRKFKTALFAAHRPGKYMQAKADEREADRNRKDAERFRQESVDFAKGLDWSPSLVGDVMPTYQRTESPLARSFLESILTGANPSSIPSTRLGAPQLRAGAQGQFDQQFGGWDELLARQRAAEQAMPWALKARPQPQRLTQAAGASASAPGWGSVGRAMTPEEQKLAALRNTPLMGGRR